MKQLTIISHTEHYRNGDGELVGLGATVTEINHLLALFDKIVHVAVLYESTPPSSALPYSSERIEFIALPAVGGKGVIRKMEVVWKAPYILKQIHKALRSSSHFQFRAPTGMGVYVIPYLIFFSSKKGWFKYAGNWKQGQAPLAYRFQRWLLKYQKRTVTINGQWHRQPSHCLSFENPCLTDAELREGLACRVAKELTPENISLCFVGRLEPAKGFNRFVKALQELPEGYKDLIEMVHFVGDGSFSEADKLGLKKSGILFAFHGVLQREAVHAIYKRSHFIVLPSKSEGFPKVVSEALNYGCVPIVSNVSSIGQYIKDGVHGVLLDDLSEAYLADKLQECLNITPERFKGFVSQPETFYYKFSYAHYNKRIRELLLKK